MFANRTAGEQTHPRLPASEVSAVLSAGAQPGLTLPTLMGSCYKVNNEPSESWQSSWITTTGVLHGYYLANIEVSAVLPAEAQPGLTLPTLLGSC